MNPLFSSRLVGLMSALLLTTFLMPLQADAMSEEKLNNRVQETMTDFRQEVPDAQEVLSKARGILVFPHVYQAGVGIGGEYGEGALLMGGKTQDYYRITSGSFGFQLGGQRKAIVMAFMTDESLDHFRDSQGWEIGADASASILVVGSEGSVKSTRLNKPIIAFVVDQKGLMYNLSLEGTKITKIHK